MSAPAASRKKEGRANGPSGLLLAGMLAVPALVAVSLDLATASENVVAGLALAILTIPALSPVMTTPDRGARTVLHGGRHTRPNAEPPRRPARLLLPEFDAQNGHRSAAPRRAPRIVGAPDHQHAATHAVIVPRRHRSPGTSRRQPRIVSRS